jgi:hypothetical protein
MFNARRIVTTGVVVAELTVSPVTAGPCGRMLP